MTKWFDLLLMYFYACLTHANEGNRYKGCSGQCTSTRTIGGASLQGRLEMASPQLLAARKPCSSMSKSVGEFSYLYLLSPDSALLGPSDLLTLHIGSNVGSPIGLVVQACCRHGRMISITLSHYRDGLM